MTRISIRPAVEADAPLIYALIVELAEYERSPQDVHSTPEMIREALFGPRPAAEALIGEIDGAAQGLALFFHHFSTWSGKRGVYLEDLFVRPAARGSGLGTALLRELARLTVSRGCPRLEWQVLDWNEPAIGFYKALGAVAMDKWTVYRLSGEALGRLAGARPAPGYHPEQGQS